MKSKYNYFQVVEIVDDLHSAIYNEFNNRKKVLGFIIGISQGENEVVCTINVFGEPQVICFPEKRIIGYKEYVNPDSFYDGDSVKIQVDSKTGRGKIVDE